MSWLQLSLTVPKEQAPLVEVLFENMDALSVTLGDAGDEPILEPGLGETPLWQATQVTAMFAGNRNQEELRNLINQSLKADVSRQLQLERLEDQAWERTWLADFHPMLFGKRLWVCPTGQRPEATDAIIMKLDPGLAFGTGTHPTTALCLKWLDSTDLRGKTVIDFGCGSGILAIAALLLGAEQAIAADHDHQALQATRDNARKNGVDSELITVMPEQMPAIKGDILLANILAGTLINLESLLASHVTSGGQIILAGILADQADEVSQTFSTSFDMRHPEIQGDWISIVGVRRG
ncbi:Ribosomal protein L11 methyltransferase [hydrothermal vent metagenome]|uniref:Ribosomal protein L11 methyltransferase n=1 Tax=hydrothermal vent metagenome TaxID=652676 RepID=A0A3B1AJV3_9ZZZZ